MRNKQAIWENVNVRPTDYKSHREGGQDNSGDCTTRCIVTCLEGKMTYREVEAEQYKIAAETNRIRKMNGNPRTVCRNTNGIWDAILKREGFSWIQLNNLKSRAHIASYLSSIKTPMASLSRTHVCAIKEGKVLDNWDSRGGRVFGILVKDEDFETAKELLTKHGIECEEVNTPKHRVNRRRVRRYFAW